MTSNLKEVRAGKKWRDRVNKRIRMAQTNLEETTYWGVGWLRGTEGSFSGGGTALIFTSKAHSIETIPLYDCRNCGPLWGKEETCPQRSGFGLIGVNHRSDYRSVFQEGLG